MSQEGWSTLSSRRRVLAVVPAFALAACGFRPMYGPQPDAAVAGLETVSVGRIGERNGQLLRRNLEQRLGRGGVPARYDLRVGLSYGVDLQGFERDGTPSRVRMTATANWFLYTAGTAPRLVAQGTDRAFDAYNLPDNQFFAADAARDAAERRLVDQLASDIVQRLAVRFEAGPPQAS